MNRSFLFPGQGAQAIGMGSDIFGEFSEACKVYERADKILGYDLSRFCFEGPLEQLNTTTISQPALFVTSAAILEVLKSRYSGGEFQADVTAGLSLGEYTAVYAAGVISFEDAVQLVQKRGEAMQSASDSSDGGMVGIIGLEDEQVIALCEEARCSDILEAVNFNCPGQVVLSGSKSACERAKELAEQYGAIKAIQLDVAGAFHTEMMGSAAELLGEALEDVEIKEPSDTKIISNITAGYYGSVEEIKEGLIKQLTSPILWQKCMERLLSEGIEDFYEIGSGRVLTGLMRRIHRKTKVVNVSNAESVKNLLQ